MVLGLLLMMHTRQTLYIAWFGGPGRLPTNCWACPLMLGHAILLYVIPYQVQWMIKAKRHITQQPVILCMRTLRVHMYMRRCLERVWILVQPFFTGVAGFNSVPAA